MKEFPDILVELALEQEAELDKTAERGTLEERKDEPDDNNQSDV